MTCISAPDSAFNCNVLAMGAINFWTDGFTNDYNPGVLALNGPATSAVNALFSTLPPSLPPSRTLCGLSCPVAGYWNVSGVSRTAEGSPHFEPANIPGKTEPHWIAGTFHLDTLGIAGDN